MNVFMFHLMPWPDLPPSYEGWAWVKCPNSLYDPRRGHELYNRYLDELLRAEALGFDGVCVTAPEGAGPDARPLGTTGWPRPAGLQRALSGSYRRGVPRGARPLRAPAAHRAAGRV